MKTHNTYQEAKIANPECEIVVQTQKSIDEFGVNGEKFEPVVENDEFTSGYSFLKNCGESPRIHDGYWEICKPADYCMTVERFLADGCKFVDGDAYLDWEGVVRIVGKVGFESFACNDIRNIAYEDQAFILRAAALEEKKPCTKVEYVKCEFNSMWEAVKAFEGGEIFHTHFTHEGWVKVEHVQQIIPNLQVEKLYRRIETEIDERQEFIDTACQVLEWSIPRAIGALYDSGRFKLID